MLVKKNRVLFVLIDPSRINLEDLVNARLLKNNYLHQCPVIRCRQNLYGRIEPITVYTIDNLQLLEDVKEIKEILNLTRKGKNTSNKIK